MNNEKTAKNKVCFVITKGVWGGAQKYVYNLATNVGTDFDTLVISGENGPLNTKLEEVGIRNLSIDSMKRDISIKSEFRSFFELFTIIKKERPDILHLNSPKAGGLGALAGRILGIKKIIYTAHGWSFNEDRSLIQKFLIRIFSYITIVLCHKVIVIAEKEKRDVLSMPLINEDKIILINNGIENVDYIERDMARKKLLEILGATFSEPNNIHKTTWIGNVAELHKNKGQEYLIKAVHKITHPVTLFIVGVGEERKNLEKLIEDLKLENKVFLVGFLDKASEYLKAFDIFVLPSIKEGLPYTLLESGLAEVPCIASSVGGIPDIIENSISGILTTKKRDGEIQRAIEYMIEKPDERERFATNLKKRIESQFSLSRMLEKTIELYK